MLTLERIITSTTNNHSPRKESGLTVLELSQPTEMHFKHRIQW